MSGEQPKGGGEKHPLPFRLERPEPDVVTVRFRGEVEQHTPDQILAALRGCDAEFRGILVHAPDHNGPGYDFDVIVWLDWRGGNTRASDVADLIVKKLDDDCKAIRYTVEWFSATEAFVADTARIEFYGNLNEQASA